MSKTIVLAVDAARPEPGQHVQAAVEMIKDLASGEDKVVVLHVHEFAVGRFGRMQVDCAEGQGERLVADIVAEWAELHQLSFDLVLDGPAGGTFRRGRDGEHIEIAAIDFIRTLAGRLPGSGVLSNPLPL